MHTFCTFGTRLLVMLAASSQQEAAQMGKLGHVPAGAISGYALMFHNADFCAGGLEAAITSRPLEKQGHFQDPGLIVCCLTRARGSQILVFCGRVRSRFRGESFLLLSLSSMDP